MVAQVVGTTCELHAERLGQVGGQRDVQADEAARRADCAIAEGLVVAGAAHAKHAAGDDVIQATRDDAGSAPRLGARAKATGAKVETPATANAQ